MFCLEVVMPKTDLRTKALMSTKLTQAFVDSTGIGSNIFNIHYCEYEIGEAAAGGKLWDKHREEPYLHLILYCPLLDRTVKQRVVEALTTAFAECAENPKWKPIIHISEYAHDNVGVDGEFCRTVYPSLI